MRAHAAGVYCVEAAVELLIGHAVWLRRSDFVGEFIESGGCKGRGGGVRLAATVLWQRGQILRGHRQATIDVAAVAVG